MRRALIVIGLLLVARVATADSIDFTQLSFGPSGTIDYGGLTITGGTGFAGIVGTFTPAPVSIVDGIGLGVGSDGSIDVRSVFENGHYVSSASTMDTTLTVSAGTGRINSLTINPYMHVEGPAPIAGVFLGFSVGGHVDQARTDSADFDYRSGPPPTFAPFVVDFTPLIKADGRDFRPVTLENFGMFWNDINIDELFRPYMLSQGFPNATFTYGFSITAIDYDPSPEPATLLLMLTALCVGVWKIRSHTVPD